MILTRNLSLICYRTKGYVKSTFNPLLTGEDSFERAQLGSNRNPGVQGLLRLA